MASVLPNVPPVDAAAQQDALLRLFAVADLLGLSASTRQRMAALAATTTATTANTNPCAIEVMMADVVVDSICKSAATAVAPPAVSSSTNASTSVKGKAAGASSPIVRSAVEASPWKPVHSTSTGSSSTTSSSPAFSLSASSPLPAVLRCRHGVARVDALDATFLPHLLVALLCMGCALEDGTETARTAPTPTATAPLHPGISSVAATTATDAAQRSLCRAAFLSLEHRYAAVVLTRHRGVCAAVTSLHAKVKLEGSAASAIAAPDTLADEVCTIIGQNADLLWVAVLLNFLSCAVDVLSAHSRRVALRDLRRSAEARTTSGLAGAHVDSVECSSRRISLTPLSAEEEEAESAWMLHAAGTLLSLVNLSLGEVEAAEEDEMIPAALVRTGGRLPGDDLPTSVVDGREGGRHTPRRFHANSIALAAVLSQVRTSLQPDTSSDSVASLLRTLFTPHAEKHAAPSDSTFDPSRHFTHLLTSYVAELQRQQHRLLSASECAVQRVLRLPSMPWRSPAMLVGLCRVTSYQLRTQLRQRHQRWRGIVARQDDTAVCAEGPLPVALDGTGASLDAAPGDVTTLFGEGLWSDDNDSEGEETSLKGSTGGTAVRRDDADTEKAATSTAAPAAALTVLALQARTHLEPATACLRPAALPCLYTPRTSSLGCYAAVQGGRGHGDALEEGSAGGGEPRDVSVRGATSACAPAASMEGLWELPTRVPRVWTPALATLMSCCALCVVPTSTLASRLSLLTGNVPDVAATVKIVGDPHTHDVGGTDGSTTHLPFTPTPLPHASSVRSSTRASPQSSLLDFGFGRWREVSVAASERSTGTDLLGPPPQHPLAAAGGGDETPVLVVGALAQWHLRCLIQQLLVPGGGVEYCVRGGPYMTECNATTTTAAWKKNGKQDAAVLSGVPSPLTVPSSAGATGGASWFAAYSHANKATSVNGPLATSSSSSTAGATMTATTPQTERGGAAVVAVSRTLSPVSISASTFALHHLLRTQERFFARAELGGSAIQELRLSVATVRGQCCGGGGSTAGSVAGMLQCVPAAMLTPSHRGVHRGGGGGGDATSAQYPRSRSLWSNRPAVGGPGADRSTSVLLDALLNLDEDSHAFQRTNVSGARAGVGGGEEKSVPQESHGGSGSRGNPTKSGESVSGGWATSCALPEALLVAVSFLGSQVVAVALPQLETPATTRTDAAVQQEWCDALQGLSVVLLDAYRAFRCRQRLQQRQQQQQAGSTAGESSMVGVSALPTSAMCRRGSSLGNPYRAASDGLLVDASPPTAAAAAPVLAPPRPVGVPPPSLSLETQFGLGVFFTALARALLQICAHRTSPLPPPPQQQQQQQQQQHSLLAERSVAQCLYAVANVLEELLHDYGHRPPAALCDVLATMAHLKLPPSTPEKRDEEVGGGSQSVWAALRRTPYWDGVLLASVESVSAAWADPSAPPADSKLRVVPPSESLLGYMPSTRDPAVTSWLPYCVRCYGGGNSGGDAVLLPEHGAATLLELVACEESLTLAAPEPLKLSAAASTPTKQLHDGGDGDGDEEEGSARKLRDEKEAEEEEERQLAVAVVASRRYAWWASRLGGAWEDAWLASVTADAFADGVA